jgi:predicted transcriptional regulator
MDEKKRSILKLLDREQAMFTLEIAQSLDLSPPTTSKYLEILKAEGKVTSYKRLPYIYWRRVTAND